MSLVSHNKSPSLLLNQEHAINRQMFDIVVNGIRMYNLDQKASKYGVFRYIALVISVCCTFAIFAQKNFSQCISDVLISKDIEKGKILMQQIKEVDIANMPDSTLFEYYYLAGWCFYENNEYEKLIDYLVKAKELCETKLGIINHYSVYFEIIKAIGEACEDLEKENEALLWYEEGLIKSIPYLNVDNDNLKLQIKDICNNAADIYEKRGYIDMAKYLRTDKPLDNVGSFDYADDLLEKAIQLNGEKKYSEAIKLLDEAKGILKKCGSEGKEMMQSLYREYLICYAGMGDKKRIDNLLRKQSTMFYDRSTSFLIRDMHEVIALFIMTHYDLKTAEYYYQKLKKMVDVHNQQDMHKIDEIDHQIRFFQQIYSQIDSLENVKNSVPLLSYEWGISSLHYSNLLVKIQRYDDANEICEQIYKMSVTLNEDPQKLHWFVLMNLSDYYSLNRDFDKAEHYLSEQLEWLDAHEITADVEERGWVYNKLGIVYLNKEQYDKSKNMWLKAEQILLPIYGNQSQEYATILHNKGRLAQLESKLDEALQYFEESIRIQIELDGKVSDRTTQYINEVKQAIKIRL